MPTTTKPILDRPDSVAQCQEWLAWKEKLCKTGIGTLGCFCQILLRSHKEVRCANCGVNGVHLQKNLITESPPDFFYCEECNDRLNIRNKNE